MMWFAFWVAGECVAMLVEKVLSVAKHRPASAGPYTEAGVGKEEGNSG